MTTPIEDQIHWYRCENDFCLRYRVMTDVLPGEEAVCAECGSMLHAADPPPARFDMTS